MNLNVNKQIFFSKEAHVYLTKDNRELMGLTSLMAKHNLGVDYGGIPEARLKEAAKKGTAIHELLQEYDEGNAILMEPLVEEYRDAISKAGLTHISSEHLVSDNEVVATFIDKVYDTGIPNTVDLADVKTTEKVHRRALSWQLGANKVLFERQNPGIKVRDCFCVHIDKNSRRLRGIIPVTPVSEAEFDALIEAEKNGATYEDNYDFPGLDLVLGEDAITYAENAGRIAYLKAQVKELEEGLKECDAKIISYMTEKGLTYLETPEGKISLKAAYTREGVDTDKLKTKYSNIYELVKKTSTVKASISFKPNK